jgi:tetratricopeptide (TPR) repeat protein
MPPLRDSLRSVPAAARSVAAGLLFTALALLAYSNSLFAPFVFDDEAAVTRNETIRDLTRWTTVLFGPQEGGATTAGRPVLNASLAVNHAISGARPWSYHAINVAIHVVSGMLVLGITRRTLHALSAPAGILRRGAGGIALSIATLWLLHPLQTEAVTYIAQRAESLMALFYLLTIYCAIRAHESTRHTEAWRSTSVACCAFGMATKEVMVTAPVVVLLYDRAFWAGSFRAAWARSRAYYSALALSWVVLAALVLSTGGNRGGTVGFGVGVSWWRYARTQFEAVSLYLTRAVWPNPLVFEYEAGWAPTFWHLLPYVAFVGALVAGTVIALGRSPRLGFTGAFFLLVLAPTSLTPGTLQTVVEHRMYLPLIAVLVVGGCAAVTLIGRHAMSAGVAVMAAFAVLTAARNRVYGSEITLWADTVAKRPANALAHYNLGHALAQSGKDAAAAGEYEKALQLDPNYATAANNLGNAYSHLGRLDDAIAAYQHAVRLRPDYGNAYYNLGCAFADAHRLTDALAAFEASLRLQPAAADVRYNYAAALAADGQPDRAITAYRQTIALRSDYAAAHINLANLLMQSGRTAEALDHYQSAVATAPALPEAHASYATALTQLRRFDEAIDAYRRALALQPKFAAAHYNLAVLLAQLGHFDEAAAHDEAALEADPGFAIARAHLEWTRRQAAKP